MVRMTCTFCDEPIVQKLPITYSGSIGSSTVADFKFRAHKSKLTDLDGHGQIDFQITRENIQLDYVIVPVRVDPADTTKISQGPDIPPPPTPANLQPPAWARNIDFVLSVRSGRGDRLEVSMQAGTSEDERRSRSAEEPGRGRVHAGSKRACTQIRSLPWKETYILNSVYRQRRKSQKRIERNDRYCKRCCLCGVAR